MNKIKTIIVLILVILTCLSISFSSTTPKICANVISVVDGDTIHISYNVQGIIIQDTIRLISVDTPESQGKYKSNPQPLALEAKYYTIKYCSNKVIYLELDKDNRDSFGRLLCYVYSNKDDKFSESLNYKLVLNKFAKVKYYKHNNKHLKELEAIK